MSIYTVVSFLISFLWIYLGARILLNDPRDRANRLFGLVCLSMVVWSFFNGLVFSLKTDTDLFTFVNLGYLGAYFFFPLNFHFYLNLSKTRAGFPLLALNYIPAAFLSVAGFMGYSIYTEFIKGEQDWRPVFDFKSVWIYLFVASILLYYFATIFVVLRWRKQTVLKKEKICGLYMLSLLTVTYIGSLILTIILPFFGIYGFEVPGAALFYIYIIGLFFLIGRFRFLNLRSGMPVNQIISNLEEMVVVTDPNLKVIAVNKKFAAELNIAEPDAGNRNLRELIAETGEVTAKIKGLTGNPSGRLDLRLKYIKKGETLVTQTNVSSVRDRFGDIDGFVVVSRLVKEAKQFQKYFKITDRELEVIELIISGFSYKEVSSTLSISDKTVETHIGNIYNKLGINNKIELVKVSRDFNIAPRQNS